MDKTERLFSMLMALPPNFEAIEEEVTKHEYTSEEITLAACKFAEECDWECEAFEQEHGRKPEDGEVHSSYIYKICKLLLKHGLDPNLVVGERLKETNIIYEMRWVDNGHIAAETVRLLLEHGGNPYIIFDGEPLFNDIDFSVIFDVAELDNKDFFDRQFRIWLVMIGYGAVTNTGHCPVTVLNQYPIEEFKNFEEFTCEIDFSKKSRTMHIIDKERNVEAARL